MLQSLRRGKAVSLTDVATVAGLAVLAFGAGGAWPIYRTSTLHTDFSCTYGTAAAMSTNLMWTTVYAGLVVALAGLLTAPPTRTRRALGLAASCAVPLLLLTAAAAAHFTGIEKNAPTMPALGRWWLFASLAAGMLFLIAGLRRWALVTALLYIPAIAYLLRLLERQLDVVLRRV